MRIDRITGGRLWSGTFTQHAVLQAAVGFGVFGRGIGVDFAGLNFGFGIFGSTVMESAALEVRGPRGGNRNKHRDGEDSQWTRT